MKLTNSQIDDLVQELQGTIRGFDGAVQEMFGVSGFDLDRETLGEFDEQLFCCDSCGWWCEMGEMSHEVEEDVVCQGCEDDYIE